MGKLERVGGSGAVLQQVQIFREIRPGHYSEVFKVVLQMDLFPLLHPMLRRLYKPLISVQMVPICFMVMWRITVYDVAIMDGVLIIQGNA